MKTHVKRLLQVTAFCWITGLAFIVGCVILSPYVPHSAWNDVPTPAVVLYWHEVQKLAHIGVLFIVVGIVSLACAFFLSE